MPTPKEVLDRLLSATLKWDDTRTASVYNEDRETLTDEAPDTILSAFSEHIENVTKGASGTKEENFQHGERRGNESWRKAVKALGVNLPKDDKRSPAEVLTELVTLKGSPEINEETVKKHPAYLSLESQFVEHKTGFEQTLTERLAARDAEFHRERILQQVTERGKQHLLSRKPTNLSTEPTKHSNQLRSFIEDLKSYNYQPLEGNGEGQFLLLDKEGKRLNDKFGHPVKIEDIFTDIGDRYFDFAVSTQRSAADLTKGTLKESEAADLPTDPQARQEAIFKASRDPNISKEKLEALLNAAKA